MASGFTALAGWAGALLFGLVAVGVAFGVQVITYIQHWALGDDSLGSAVSYGHGWDDDCQFQAWITLNISLHDVHHREPRLPYYRLQLTADSQRLPAGHVMLMFVSLVPPVWRRAMEPALCHRLRGELQRGHDRQQVCERTAGAGGREPASMMDQARSPDPADRSHPAA